MVPRRPLLFARCHVEPPPALPGYHLYICAKVRPMRGFCYPESDPGEQGQGGGEGSVR